MNRSSWASGRVRPSCSIGFWVATTKKGPAGAARRRRSPAALHRFGVLPASWRGPVHLVGQNDVREHRPAEELELRDLSLLDHLRSG